MTINEQELVPIPEQPTRQSAEQETEILDAIKAIRKSDCGAWVKDCIGGMFSCSDGRAKRTELARLLDRLYKAAGI